MFVVITNKEITAEILVFKRSKLVIRRTTNLTRRRGQYLLNTNTKNSNLSLFTETAEKKNGLFCPIPKKMDNKTFVIQKGETVVYILLLKG